MSKRGTGISRPESTRRRASRLLLAAIAAMGLALPSQAAAATFKPVADAYVDASAPTSNYGKKTTLKTDASPVRNSYLRFNVQGVGPVTSARLRIRANSSNGVGFRLHAIGDNGWSETGITFDNAPPIGPYFTASGAVKSSTWYEFDVSQYVTGDGEVSFALTSASTTSTSYSSREGSFSPELIAPAAPTPSSFTVTRDGTTYHAQSPDGTSYTGTLKFVVESAVQALRIGGGGTITFGSGTFDLGSDFFELKDMVNVTFQGQGMAATIIQNNNSASADTEPFNISTADGVVVRDLTVNAAGALRTTSDALDFDGGNNTLIERVRITSSRGRGIVFDGKDILGPLVRKSENNVVRDCEITGVPSDGIELLAARFNRIEGCTITGVGGHGIQITKSSTLADQPNKKSNDNVLTGNVIDQSGQDGVNVISGDRNDILGNTIFNSADDTSGRDGIRISSGDSIACDDNEVSGNTATDNQAVKTQRYGLRISSSLCHRTVVSGNDFSGNLSGALLDAGTDTQFTP